MQPLRSASESQLADECAGALLAGIPGVMRFIRTHMRVNRAGLTIPQFRTLVLLNLVDKPSLSELAEHLGLSLPAASRMVELLVRRGLVKRRGRSEDRRRICLSLTPAGKQAFQSAHQATQLALARHLAGISKGDLGRLSQGMRILGQVFVAENGQSNSQADQPKAAVKTRVRRTGVSSS